MTKKQSGKFADGVVTTMMTSIIVTYQVTVMIVQYRQDI